MIVDSVVADIARHWDVGWNRADVAVIMELFSPDVVFSSPYVSRLTGVRGQTTVEGFDAVEAYVVAALDRASDVRYTLQSALAGTDTVILVYTCHFPDGASRPGADIMSVDQAGKVVEWRCHYATDPKTWRE